MYDSYKQIQPSDSLEGSTPKLKLACYVGVESSSESDEGTVWGYFICKISPAVHAITNMKP